jgi:SOS-response transcriptional repressor LexA
MDKKKLQNLFLTRLKEYVAPEFGMQPYDRGLMSAITKKFHVSVSKIQRWFEESMPRAETLMELYETFGVTPNYLLGIEKSEFRPDRIPIPVLELATSASIRDKPLRYNEFTTVPLVSGTIAAGIETIIVDEQIEDWAIVHKNITGQRKNLISIRIDKRDGMSMYPILQPGALVIIDRDDKRIVPGGIYAIRDDIGCTVKRLQQAGHQLLLIPENKSPEYQTKIIDLRENPTPIIGRIIWCSKAL